MPHRTPEEVSADGWGEWEERAAIREFDGGMSRAEAEAMTTGDLGPSPSRPEREASQAATAGDHLAEYAVEKQLQ